MFNHHTCQKCQKKERERKTGVVKFEGETNP